MCSNFCLKRLKRKRKQAESHTGIFIFWLLTSQSLICLSSIWTIPISKPLPSLGGAYGGPKPTALLPQTQQKLSHWQSPEFKLHKATLKQKPPASAMGDKNQWWYYEKFHNASKSCAEDWVLNPNYSDASGTVHNLRTSPPFIVNCLWEICVKSLIFLLDSSWRLF